MQNSNVFLLCFYVVMYNNISSASNNVALINNSETFLINSRIMKQLAVYHKPQECGEPYVMLVNLEDGQPVRTIDIPNGYSYSGMEVEHYYEPATGKRKVGYRFDASKDTFRHIMEEQGINMTGWCVYKRSKTDFMDFLRAIMPNEVINIIRIK